MRYDTVERERERPRTASVRGKEKRIERVTGEGVRTREEGRIQSPRRAVVPPSSFLRRRALLTKLFRDRGKKKSAQGRREEIIRRQRRTSGE